MTRGQVSADDETGDQDRKAFGEKEPEGHLSGQGSGLQPA